MPFRGGSVTAYDQSGRPEMINAGNTNEYKSAHAPTWGRPRELARPHREGDIMKTNAKLAATAAVLSVAASASAAPPGSDPPPDSFPVTVINDQTEPVPVEGEVTGSVAVTSVPAALTDRLDLVLDGLEDLNEAVQATGQPRASYAEYLKFDEGPCGGPTLCSPPTERYFSQPVWASFIAISTENDDGFIEFYSGPEAQVPVLRFGHPNRQLPGVITATLPQAVRISYVKFACRNDLEDCEVAISVIGDIAQ